MAFYAAVFGRQLCKKSRLLSSFCRKRFTTSNSSINNYNLQLLNARLICQINYKRPPALFSLNRQQIRFISLTSIYRNEESIKESQVKDKILTVPNILTLSRVVMTPFLSYYILNGQLNTACGIFVLAGLTDLLDGYIARNVPGQKSAFGSFMDPLADKLLISTMFISLTVVQLMPLPLTILVFLRDFFLIIAAFYVRFISLPPPRTFYRYFDATHATSELRPTLISKWNTALQLCTVAFTLVSPVLGFQDNWLLSSLCILTAGTTVISGIQYMFAKDTFKIITARQNRKLKDLTK